MEYNVPLMREVSQWLWQHPERHNQNRWLLLHDWLPHVATRDVEGRTEQVLPVGDFEVILSCGTTGCLAGWTVVLADRNQVGPVIPVRDLENYDGNLEFIQVSEQSRGTESISSRAARLLGLDEDEQRYLFNENRTIVQIIEHLEDITGVSMGVDLSTPQSLAA